MKKLSQVLRTNVCLNPPSRRFAGWFAKASTLSQSALSNDSRGLRQSVLLVFFAMGISLLPGTLVAQVENGTITGRVTDPSGAVVPGASVTVSQKSTGLLLHGQTNDDGTYTFPQLQPGPYGVVVDKPGFKKTDTSITLTVGQVAQLDVQLPVGSETEV
jgi:hypothetical protein